MKSVYLIMALDDYSASYAVCYFKTQEKADSFMAKISKHEALKPEPMCSDGEDNEFDLWEASWNRWKNRHPAGAEYADSDGFEIVKVRGK